MEGDCKSTDALCDANLSVSMPTSVVGISEYVTAADSVPDSSGAEVGCGSMSDCQPSASDSVSLRMERLMQCRSEYGSAVEFEIEASKVHWTEVDEWGDKVEGKESDLEVYERLKQKWGGFFRDYGDSLVLRERIGEGGQAEIFNAWYKYPEGTSYPGYKEETVVKVFKHGWTLRNLEKLLPLGMLANDNQGGWFGGSYSSLIWGATLLKNGRLAFRMQKHWGDLRKLIVERNNHQSPPGKLRALLRMNRRNDPPFTKLEECRILLSITQAMFDLHEQDILHRDLKAANVLIDTLQPENDTFDYFDPIHHKFDCIVADFECSVGVAGTGYWRAPELLQAEQNGRDKHHFFTKKVDVYSFAMTCYEVLTGRIPFEDLRADCYNVVIEGRRPELPPHIDPLLKALLTRCWQTNPLERPSFAEIGECLKEIYSRYVGDTSNEASDDEALILPDEASDNEALILPYEASDDEALTLPDEAPVFSG